MKISFHFSNDWIGGLLLIDLLNLSIWYPVRGVFVINLSLLGFTISVDFSKGGSDG